MWIVRKKRKPWLHCLHRPLHFHMARNMYSRPPSWEYLRIGQAKNEKSISFWHGMVFRCRDNSFLLPFRFMKLSMWMGSSHASDQFSMIFSCIVRIAPHAHTQNSNLMFTITWFPVFCTGSICAILYCRCGAIYILSNSDCSTRLESFHESEALWTFLLLLMRCV